MSWLKEKFRSWLFNNDHDYEREVQRISRSSFNTSPWMHITVYTAIGGKIVEFARPDSEIRIKNSIDYSNNTQLYIIKEDQDFGKSLSKILTLESLK